MSTRENVWPPTNDRVKQLFTIAKRSPRISEQLENWYTPEKIPSDPLSSKIHCQKMSCWWDVTLRRKWSNVLKAVLWIFIMLVLCLSVVTGNYSCEAYLCICI